MAKVRRPVQAGAFYEGTSDALKQQIRECFIGKLGPGKLPIVKEAATKNLIGLICPHAGYMYSGMVAAHAYYKLALDGKPSTVVILGPNHTGYGSGLAIQNEGAWRTPLGDIEVDTETANRIVAETDILDIDDSAHRNEHSIEVQLPFLQYLYGLSFKIVPICFLMQDLSSAREVGEGLAKALRAKNAVVIASSDMTHYESQESAERKDKKAIEAIEAMNEARLLSVIESNNITACGPGPIISLITAARAMGGTEARLLCYKTSGDVTGDASSVVGYAAFCFMK
jgi:AmmeMemoRadiSam system protein B